MKEKIPQLCKVTGVSCDYINTWCASYCIWRDTKRMKEVLREIPIKKYAAWFPSGEYEEVITEKNKVRVKRLDKLVDIINLRAQEDTLSLRDFKRIINLVCRLIYGSEERGFPGFNRNTNI